MLSGLENPVHLLLVLVILLAVFGAKRLPEMGRSIGGGLRGFKDALTEPEASHAAAVELDGQNAERSAAVGDSANRAPVLGA